jgi:hypothetical protein
VLDRRGWETKTREAAGACGPPARALPAVIAARSSRASDCSPRRAFRSRNTGRTSMIIAGDRWRRSRLACGPVAWAGRFARKKRHAADRSTPDTPRRPATPHRVDRCRQIYTIGSRIGAPPAAESEGRPDVLSGPGFFAFAKGIRPSRCAFLRASLCARRIASPFSRVDFSEGFS